MEKGSLVKVEKYIWFWLDISHKIESVVYYSQVLFWDKIFEILWHDTHLENLKKECSETLINYVDKIIYFDLEERSYELDTPDWIEKIVKLKIIRIIED